MQYVVHTFGGVLARYGKRRIARLAYWAKRPLGFAEIVSAVLVFGETFNVYAHLCAHAGCYVHPVAASATMIALVAHLPEL